MVAALALLCRTSVDGHAVRAGLPDLLIGMDGVADDDAKLVGLVELGVEEPPTQQAGKLVFCFARGSGNQGGYCIGPHSCCGCCCRGFGDDSDAAAVGGRFWATAAVTTAAPVATATAAAASSASAAAAERAARCLAGTTIGGKLVVERALALAAWPLAGAWHVRWSGQ